jgi:hypothetical protein
MVSSNITNQHMEVKIMTKERRSNREGKKKAAMTPKEKKAAKRAKNETKNLLTKE